MFCECVLLSDDANMLAPPLASEKCQQEKRKTVNGEDILFAMTSLGFENYAEALKIYLSKYREVRPEQHVPKHAVSPESRDTDR